MLHHCMVWVNLCVFTIEIEHVLFSEVRILGDAAFTRKPIAHQHGERGISKGSAIPQKGLLLWVQWVILSLFKFG